MLFFSLPRPPRSSPRPPSSYPQPPSSTTTTFLYYDYQTRRRLPTSPPSTYLLVYFVVAVCYQVSTFATAPSSFSLIRSFRFTHPFVYRPSKSSLLAVLCTLTDSSFQCSLRSLYMLLPRFVPPRLSSTARSPSIL